MKETKKEMWKEMKWHKKIKWNYPKPKKNQKIQCERKSNDTKKFNEPILNKESKKQNVKKNKMTQKT